MKKLKPKRSADVLGQMYSGGSTPSLLNGSGDGKAISNAGLRGSRDIAVQDSPPHSRSSSAHGSYSTSATTFEDSEEKRGRDDVDDNYNDGKRRRESGKKEKESKGNVIVSVRVRPDAGGDKSSSRDWLVDGRQSLITYKGREGGDYFYGKLRTYFRDPMLALSPPSWLSLCSQRHIERPALARMLNIVFPSCYISV